MVNKIIYLTIYITLLFLGLLLINIACNKNKECSKGSHNIIVINNNSSKTINWRLFDSDSVYILNGTPYDEIINSNNSEDYSLRNETCWEEFFKTVNNGFQYFLIFDNDTVQAISWYAISGTNRGLLKCIKVDLNYLKQNNYTITYN